MRVGELLESRFELLSHYATGGMGVVYRARDRETGSQVAVKVLRGRGRIDVQRFELEARLMQKLVHPRIVRYIAAGITHDGARYLVEEWVDGISLRDHMTRTGLTPSEAVMAVRNLAEALAEAHRHGVVHRDVKPDNVILQGGELSHPRLLDFGIAREMFDGRPDRD
ncbi:MAG: serine/threonine-protein kinase [Myxococcota bacterium]